MVESKTRRELVLGDRPAFDFDQSRPTMTTDRPATGRILTTKTHPPGAKP
jgi:hypothetical protein